jgi:hypothetical protein
MGQTEPPPSCCHSQSCRSGLELIRRVCGRVV